MSKISPTMEDYMETILLLQREQGDARVTDIANRMNVAKSSVHTALHTLADRGLITQEKYSTIFLTPEGLALSQAVYARHRSLITFFERILGVSPVNAENDACAAEHVLSDETMQKILLLMEKSLPTEE